MNRHSSLWNWFKDKAEKNIEGIKQYEKDFEMTPVYELQPKMNSVLKILASA